MRCTFSPSTRRVDGAAVLAEVSHGKALICPRERVIRELRREGEVRGVVLRRDDQAAGVAVDAVDDAGALFAADAGETVAAVVQKRVHERPVRVTGGGVDDHARRLVHNDHVLILIHDVERDVLRGEHRLLRRGDADGNRLAGGDAGALGRARAADRDRPLLDEPRGL